MRSIQVHDTYSCLLTYLHWLLLASQRRSAMHYYGRGLVRGAVVRASDLWSTGRELDFRLCTLLGLHLHRCFWLTVLWAVNHLGL